MKYIVSLLVMLLVTPAYAQTGTAKSAAQLNAEVASQLPTNSAGQITALQLRQVVLDFIASSLGPLVGVTASPNTVLAGPPTGTTVGTPSFRALTSADLPASGSVTAAAIKSALGFTPQTIFNVADYGAVGNGTTDDQPAFLAALTACSVTGGTVMIGPLVYLISAGNLTIPINCTLSGAAHWVGNYQGGGTSPLYPKSWPLLGYTTQPFTLLLNPARSIIFSRNSGLTNLQVTNATIASTTAINPPTTLQTGINLVNSFSGTALRVGDNPLTTVGTGSRIKEVAVWGFSTCLSASYPVDVSEFFGDCTGGLNLGEVAHMGDEVRMHHIQIFPWMTQNQVWTNFSSNITGTANHGDGTIDITLATPTGLATGTQYHVVVIQVGGTIEANGGWTGTVNSDGTINLVGSTFTNAYTSGGGFRLTVNYRSGTAYQVATLGCDGCGFSHVFELGHATAFHFGTSALFAYCYECSFDSPQGGDNSTIGYLIDSTASSISLSGEFQSQKGTGIRVNTLDTSSRSHHLNTPRISSASNGSTFDNGTGSYAVEVLQGNLTIMGGYIANAIHVGASAGQLILDDVDGHGAGNVVVDGNNAGALQLRGGRWPAKLTPDGSMENRLLNGDFTVSQILGNSLATIGGNSYVVDGWKVRGSGLFADFSHQRGTASSPAATTLPTPPPTGDGASHPFFYRHTVTAAATPGATDYEYFGNRIEGNLITDLDWGNGTNLNPVRSKSVVVSLWLRSTVTGAFSIALTNTGQARSYVHNCTTTAISTWTYCAFVVPGDTAGTWSVTRSQVGIELTINLGSGSNYQTTADVWTAGNFYSATGSKQLVETNGASLDVTGVRLRAGTADVPYIPRPFATEFEMARRYYQTSFTLETPPATNGGLAGAVCTTNPFPNSQPAAYVQLSPPMMTTPTITTYNPSASGGNWRDVTAGSDVTSSVDPAVAKGSTGFLISTGVPVANLADILCIQYAASAAL